MTDLESHRHIVSVRLTEDEDSGELVYVVTTSLIINLKNPAFDEAAFSDLQRHIQKWQTTHSAIVMIEGPV